MVKSINECRVWVTGGQGLLGGALCRLLSRHGVEYIAPTRFDLDLLDSDAVKSFVAREKPDVVIHLASKVFGLKGNLENQFDVLSTNTRLNDSVFSSLINSTVKRLFFAGTVAAYPFPYQGLPLTEDQLFFGEPHCGEYGYAASKIHAYSYLKILQDYFGIECTFGAFTNLYGPGDRFDTESGHVIPSLIKKAFSAAVEGKGLSVWGRPDTTRDFLYVDDAASAIIRLCDSPGGIYNISTGCETSMKDVVNHITVIAGLLKPPEWQSDMPVGIPHRVVSCNRLMDLGWSPEVSLKEGLQRTYFWFSENFAASR